MNDQSDRYQSEEQAPAGAPAINYQVTSIHAQLDRATTLDQLRDTMHKILDLIDDVALVAGNAAEDAATAAAERIDQHHRVTLASFETIEDAGDVIVKATGANVTLSLRVTAEQIELLRRVAADTLQLAGWRYAGSHEEPEPDPAWHCAVCGSTDDTHAEGSFCERCASDPPKPAPTPGPATLDAAPMLETPYLRRSK